MIAINKIVFGLNDTNLSDFLSRNVTMEKRVNLTRTNFIISYCWVDTGKYFFSKRLETALNGPTNDDNEEMFANIIVRHGSVPVEQKWHQSSRV